MDKEIGCGESKMKMGQTPTAERKDNTTARLIRNYCFVI